MSLRLTVRTYHVLLLLALFIFSILFWPPRSRGFDCADTSIKHPFEPIIFRTSWLFVVSLLVPWLLIHRLEPRCDRGRQVVRFLFGFMVNLLVTEIAKRSVGRLRPHTFDFCNLQRYCPNTTASLYIDKFECENANSLYVVNTHLSFYSGHSSIACFAGTYLVLYLIESKVLHLLGARYKLFHPLAYVIIVAFYLLPGFTQYLIHWHFLSDVLVGWSSGCLFALTIFATVNRRGANELVSPIN